MRPDVFLMSFSFNRRDRNGRVAWPGKDTV